MQSMPMRSASFISKEPTATYSTWMLYSSSKRCLTPASRRNTCPPRQVVSVGGAVVGVGTTVGVGTGREALASERATVNTTAAARSSPAAMRIRFLCMSGLSFRGNELFEQLGSLSGFRRQFGQMGEHLEIALGGLPAAGAWPG